MSILKYRDLIKIIVIVRWVGDELRAQILVFSTHGMSTGRTPSSCGLHITITITITIITTITTTTIAITTITIIITIITIITITIISYLPIRWASDLDLHNRVLFRYSTC